MPTNETGFAYDELIAFMKNRSETEGSGTVFPDNVRLAVISLNNDFDGKDFRQEREFWDHEAHEALGNLTQWPIGVAGVLPPSAFPVDDRDWMANESNPEGVWCIDQVPSRVRTIRRMLLTPSDPPVAIYVHCTAGCDRTGEMIGAYIIEHVSQNVTEMYAEDTKQCGRSPDYFSTAVSYVCVRACARAVSISVSVCLSLNGLVVVFLEVTRHDPQRSRLEHVSILFYGRWL